MTPSKQATVSDVKNEPGSEIFDDLYLGVRAGGALRKKRRGELLTAEEAEALSRWQRLSAWRKGFAVGGFSFTHTEKVVDLGPIEASADKKESVPIPPVLAGLALVGGVVLLVAGTRRT